MQFYILIEFLPNDEDLQFHRLVLMCLLVQFLCFFGLLFYFSKFRYNNAAFLSDNIYDSSGAPTC